VSCEGSNLTPHGEEALSWQRARAVLCAICLAKPNGSRHDGDRLFVDSGSRFAMPPPGGALGCKR